MTTPVRVGSVSILDDARPGMNPDIRPQDDLFGHVNGRWLDETEIPSDRSSWGPFVAARRRRRAAGARHHHLARRDAGRRRSTRTPARSVTSTRRSWTRRRSTGSAPGRSSRWSTPSRGCATCATWRRSSASSSASAAPACSGPTSTPTTATPTATCSTSPRAGSACPTRATTATTSSPRSARRTSPTSPACSSWRGHADPAAAAQTVLDLDTRLAKGHWERAETRDVQKTYNLMTLEELQALAPAFDWEAYATNLGGSAETIAESCVRQPSYLAHLSTVLEEVDIEQWRPWLLFHVLRSRRALPARRLRADQLRLLRPHPQRHARAARAVEAWRRAGRGRHRRGRRPGLRRPPLPAGVQGEDGRPRGQPAPGLPRLHRGARLDDRGDQAAGLRQARHLPAQDRLPGEVPRLQQPAGHAPAT